MQKKPHAKDAKSAKERGEQRHYASDSGSPIGELFYRRKFQFLCSDLCGLCVRQVLLQLHRLRPLGRNLKTAAHGIQQLAAKFLPIKNHLA
jgi:hypothetical protein